MNTCALTWLIETYEANRAPNKWKWTRTLCQCAW